MRLRVKLSATGFQLIAPVPVGLAHGTKKRSAGNDPMDANRWPRPTMTRRSGSSLGLERLSHPHPGVSDRCAFGSLLWLQVQYVGESRVVINHVP